MQELLREHFVSVAADDWYQRRQDDALGRFFREVASQGPRKGAGGSTQQGRYVFSASGKLLGFNNNRDPERILRMLRDSLAAFEALPEQERAPGAVTIPALAPTDLDQRYSRIPPADGLVVKVHARVLEQDPQSGRFVACGTPGKNTSTYRHNGFGASTDHLWITAPETEALLGALRDGGKVPAPVAVRLARFHLVDNTRGEPPHWRREEIRSLRLTGKPIEGNPDRLSLTGQFHLETADGSRGYQGALRGVVEVQSGVVKRLDLVALGQHWGEGPYTGGARPGKTPLGIAFTLGDPEAPADRVPPQGIRWEDGYYQADRH